MKPNKKQLTEIIQTAQTCHKTGATLPDGCTVENDTVTIKYGDFQCKFLTGDFDRILKELKNTPEFDKREPIKKAWHADSGRGVGFKKAHYTSLTVNQSPPYAPSINHLWQCEHNLHEALKSGNKKLIEIMQKDYDEIKKVETT